MDQIERIITAAVNDYKNSGGSEWDLLNNTASALYAKVREEYPHDVNAERFQCMIIVLHAVLSADNKENLIDLINPLSFVIEPLKTLYSALIDEPMLVDVIHNIRDMCAGNFIKSYFNFYEVAKYKYETWAEKAKIVAVNVESLEKLKKDMNTSFANYNDVLRFCERYRPAIKNKIKPLLVLLFKL